MKVGTLLLILHDVIEALVGQGLLTAAGDFIGPNLQQDFNLVSIVETAAKNHGVDVPSEVDKIVQILPLVLSIAGVK